MNQDIDIEMTRSIMFEPTTPDPSTRAAARARLMIAAAPVPVAHQARWRAARRLDWRVGLGMVSAGATAAAAALAISLLGQGGIGQPAVASAATVLTRAALSVTGAVTADPGPGQYLHTKQIWTTSSSDSDRTDASGDAKSAEVTQVYNTWLGAHGGLQTRETTQVNGTPVNSKQIITGVSQTSFNSTRYGTIEGTIKISSGGLGRYTYDQLLAMPTDPTALRTALQRDAAAANTDGSRQQPQEWVNHAMFNSIHDILMEQLVPAKLRAALYRVAATIPGVRVVGLERDAAGRDALAVTFKDPLYNERDELLFDPKTYLLTGESKINTTTGRVEESEAIVQTQIADAIPAAVRSAAQSKP